MRNLEGPRKYTKLIKIGRIFIKYVSPRTNTKLFMGNRLRARVGEQCF